MPTEKLAELCGYASRNLRLISHALRTDKRLFLANLADELADQLGRVSVRLLEETQKIERPPNE